MQLFISLIFALSFSPHFLHFFKTNFYSIAEEKGHGKGKEVIREEEVLVLAVFYTSQVKQ